MGIKTWFFTQKGDVALPITPAGIDELPIGQTTPAAANFTTLGTTGDATVGGGLGVAGLVAESVQVGITASTTHTIAGGTALTKQVNVVSTCANAGDAVTLANLAVGQHQDVYNAGAAAAGVYPAAAGIAIDGGTAGAAVTLTNAKRCRYTCVAANTILSEQLGAASA